MIQSSEQLVGHTLIFNERKKYRIETKLSFDARLAPEICNIITGEVPHTPEKDNT